jgi:diguanylate cyclase (GGDEF)-like protein
MVIPIIVLKDCVKRAWTAPPAAIPAELTKIVGKYPPNYSNLACFYRRHGIVGFFQPMPSMRQTWDKLLWARFHSPEISHERYRLILSRVQFVSRLFGILTILWIGVEFVCWPAPVSNALALERVFAACAFWTLGTCRFEARKPGIRGAILALFLIPSALILGVEFVLAHSGAHLEQAFGTQAYLLSPLLLAASLGIFPLTAVEGALLAGPLIPVMALPMILWPELFGTISPMAAMLLLTLVAGISAIASLSQLNFLISLVEKSATDGLTGAVTRKFGERMLDTAFAISLRKNIPLTILFIDIDRFKSVNDRFGHAAGDEVLRGVATSIANVVRRQDVLVRWGGEEFLLIMPGTGAGEVGSFIGRLTRTGIGFTPDAVAVTASMGAAERLSDKADNWAAMVDMADRRMYEAKEAGRNCYVGPNGIPAAGMFGSPRTAADTAVRSEKTRIRQPVQRRLTETA